MTGKTPTNIIRIDRANPAKGSVRIPPASSAISPHPSGLDERFTPWLTSFPQVTGVAGEMNSLSENAEVFLEMFSPIGS